MTPNNAVADWHVAVFYLAGFFFLCLVLGAGFLAWDWRAARRASRTRLAALPPLAPEQLDAGVERLRGALQIPAQREAGERRAG